DLVHTHGKGAGLYGRLAAWRVGVPSVHTFHGIHYENYSRASRYLYLTLERWLAGITHMVINVSTTQDAEALRLGVARPGRSVVVVNGIDVGELDARPRSDRASLGLGDDEQVIGCVARFDPIKKHEVLVKALATVVKRHPKAVLLLVGEGPQKAEIDRLASQLEVRVVSPGAIGSEANAYSSCDLYVTASSKEGLPLAPLEAMASWRAVIATKVPGHQDVVDDGKTGLLVPRDDPEAMAAAIGSLLDDRSRSERMGQAGSGGGVREVTGKTMGEKNAGGYPPAGAGAN